MPWSESDTPVQGLSPRGMDVDSDGVVWTVLASGHFASFDRTKCTGPLNGPTATGRHCPEGWTLHQFPGPNFKGAVDGMQQRARAWPPGRVARHWIPGLEAG